MKRIFVACLFLLVISSCQKKDNPIDTPATNTSIPVSICPTCSYPDSTWAGGVPGPNLIFKFQLDSTQTRLNNLGAPESVASGNAGQSPRFNGISARYIELVPSDLTPTGEGTIIYKADETTCGGSNAITFCKSLVVKNGDVFYSTPLNKVAAGSYKWLRISVGYQNFDIKVRTNSTGTIDGTVASFIGYSTYVSKYKMHSTVMTPTLNGVGNKSQGYWGVYTSIFNTDFKLEGQAPQTTVVNPNPNSPIPTGSDIITGEFYKTSASGNQPLTITGSETQDIIITVSLSTNKSFEWKEVTFDGIFQPEIGETIVDMGLRGLIPKY